MAKTLLERFEEKFTPEPNSGCWLWTAYCNPDGYGTLANSGPRGSGWTLAHRVAYEIYVGTIPVGLDIDHLCRVRCCVNPAHLEPVTRRENVMRGINPALTKARRAAQTHCPQGHEYSVENTRIRYQKGYRCRGCRACDIAIKKRRYACTELFV